MIGRGIDRFFRRERHSVTAALGAAVTTILIASVILPGGVWLIRELLP